MKLFDNIDLPLGAHLKKTLQVSDSLDVAVGYFNLRGWRQFDEIVRAKAPEGQSTSPVVRILIGMATPTPQEDAIDRLQADVDGIDELGADPDKVTERKLQILNHLREQLMRGRPTATDRAVLQSLRDLLDRGVVQIKVFTRRPLHGKTYVCHRQDLNNPITGFVGSSNLTGPGLSSNLELNVDVLDLHAAKALADWFTDRWDDEYSRPVSSDLLDLLDQSWARVEPRPPYEVFMKVCYDLSRDVRDGLAEYSIPPEINTLLLDYQATAVRTLARRLITRRGTMLGDVVGLGKTLTAIAAALMLRDEYGFQPLIVCPLNLVKMWQEHLEAYDLHGRVVSYSMAHRQLPEMRRYKFVIIDESHTLRNNTRRDYQAIRDYILANDSHVLLLTATPYNLRFSDVANQLGLFIEEDDDLGIAPTNALQADPGIADKVDSKTNTLAAFRYSENADDWKRLMSENLIRRTRSFIKTNYAHIDEEGREYLQFSNGDRFTFPQRIATPINHSFGITDPAAIMSSPATLDAIRDLILPRYDLRGYLRKTVDFTQAEKQFVDNVQRGHGHAAGFVRTTFYKRLTSCGQSFLISLQRHLARNELFIYAIENDLPIPTGTIDNTNYSTPHTDADDDDPNNVDGEDANTTDEVQIRYDILEALAPTSVTWIRPGIFNSGLLKDLHSDTTSIRTLIASFGAWSTQNDSKLAALIELLTKTHPDEKVLIFTEYKDTANYVAAALIAAGIEHIGLATGETENPTDLAARFSPLSNTLPNMENETLSIDEQLRVLVATDVLSEGQNLQDAHIVVNYDLPWAIIRLIQRAGRVDRVGQRSDTVRLYSFFHQSLDNVIDLLRRINERLKANAQAFGSDEQFFGSEGEVQAITDLYNGTLDDTEAADDVDASSLAYEYWHKLETSDPDLAARIAALPDMIDATRQRRILDSEDAALCYVRTAAGTDGFGAATSTGALRLLTGHETLSAFQATPEELGLERRDDHDTLVTELIRGPLQTPHATAGRLRKARRQVWKRLGNQLRPSDTDTEEALEALYTFPLTTTAEQRLGRAIREGVSDTDLLARVVALHRDKRLVINTRTGLDPIRIVSTMGITQ